MGDAKGAERHRAACTGCRSPLTAAAIQPAAPRFAALLWCSFKEAEKVLELEMKESIPAGELLVQSWLGWGGEGVEERLLFATAGEGDPAELVQAFDRLAAWVDNSLDIYNVGAAAGGWQRQECSIAGQPAAAALGVCWPAG